MKADGCNAKPDTEELQCGNVKKEVYSGCKNGSAVVLYIFGCGTHTWPKPVDGACDCDACKCDKPGCSEAPKCDKCKCDNFPATDVFWDFFNAHLRP